MILRVNGTSETIWLPVYTLNGDHESLYLILGALEIISYLITALVVLKTCRIIAKSRQFHGNMNLLVVCFMAQWFEALLSKIAIMPYQMYTILWYINERMRRNFSKPGAFRLAQQFQVKENIRHIMLTKNIICSATVYVAISCSLLMILVFDMVPEWLKNPLAHCVENCIFLNPLLICTVSMFSEPAWKKEFIQSIPLVSHVFSADKQSLENKKSLRPVEETEMYFNQFKMAWV
uniref:Uncharacterized protein n=2 Tax=Caenorhabditis japonica TaxID=281687 RepID=A0A8R1IVT7_CAEJA